MQLDIIDIQFLRHLVTLCINFMIMIYKNAEIKDHFDTLLYLPIRELMKHAIYQNMSRETGSYKYVTFQVENYYDY